MWYMKWVSWVGCLEVHGVGCHVGHGVGCHMRHGLVAIWDMGWLPCGTWWDAIWDIVWEIWWDAIWDMGWDDLWYIGWDAMWDMGWDVMWDMEWDAMWNILSVMPWGGMPGGTYNGFMWDMVSCHVGHRNGMPCVTSGGMQCAAMDRMPCGT